MQEKGNHLHLVLRSRPDVVAEWSDDEVVLRWWRLFPQRRGAGKRCAGKNAGKRVQEPFAGFFTGLPRGVTVLSRPSCLILRRDQFESPNGQPRFILLCRAVCSLAVMGWFTCLSQPGFLGSGHFESSSFSRGVPECQRYKLLKRQSSARSTRLGGAFWSSHSKTINQAAQNVNLRFLTPFFAPMTAALLAEWIAGPRRISTFPNCGRIRKRKIHMVEKRRARAWCIPLRQT